MQTGKIVQVMGPVVDVLFEGQTLPSIKDALEVDNGWEKVCHGSSTAHRKQIGSLYYAEFQ